MDYYDDDLSPTDSLISLQTADAVLATSLHGRDWTARAVADKQAIFEDPERTPERTDDKAALCDASTIMASQPWKGRKASPDQHQAFPRIGVHLETGASVHGVPLEIQRATALLAAHLIKRADMPLSPELMVSYSIGETSGIFRSPSQDELPRHIRQLIAPFLNVGSGWAPVRA
ncbi:DnaT-like ssDNA-binding protein [Brevundimonas sp.]|jgi:hypothetical protein|uniref:DnaT-like ssDNA-binding protein n=1 Tax=Brevundimonas sp. TaxID=1871086 RepID=UPI0028B21580|nr:DnaT-like ssDNA-binding protein [Brevundimonas sp.]